MSKAPTTAGDVSACSLQGPIVCSCRTTQTIRHIGQLLDTAASDGCRIVSHDRMRKKDATTTASSARLDRDDGTSQSLHHERLWRRSAIVEARMGHQLPKADDDSNAGAVDEPLWQ